MSPCESCEKSHAFEGTPTALAVTPFDEDLAAATDLEAPTPAFVPGTVRVAADLGLGESEVTASKAVSIEGSNAVRVDILVANLTLSSISFRVQVSNDAVGWLDAAQFRKTTIGYATTKVRGIGFRFVRLFYEASDTAGGEGVLAASLHHWRN
ncbi:MAG: hypothetical protein FD180_5216 [Planctomycetota bacterium]|nr:MAG: hypothetical protein FD180_5216 [Planctomycetota bacterium]